MRYRPGDDNNIQMIYDIMNEYGDWDKHMEWVKGDEQNTNIYKLGGLMI